VRYRYVVHVVARMPDGTERGIAQSDVRTNLPLTTDARVDAVAESIRAQLGAEHVSVATIKRQRFWQRA
jgi:hypothetical protein